MCFAISSKCLRLRLPGLRASAPTRLPWIHILVRLHYVDIDIQKMAPGTTSRPFWSAWLSLPREVLRRIVGRITCVILHKRTLLKVYIRKQSLKLLAGLSFRPSPFEFRKRRSVISFNNDSRSFPSCEYPFLGLRSQPETSQKSLIVRRRRSGGGSNLDLVGCMTDRQPQPGLSNPLARVMPPGLGPSTWGGRLS